MMTGDGDPRNLVPSVEARLRVYCDADEIARLMLILAPLLEAREREWRQAMASRNADVRAKVDSEDERAEADKQLVLSTIDRCREELGESYCQSCCREIRSPCRCGDTLTDLWRAVNDGERAVR